MSLPERSTSPRPPREHPRNFYLNARDSDDDFYGAAGTSAEDINEIVPADDVNAPLAGRDNRLSASDSTHPSNVFADPTSPASHSGHGHSPATPVDPYRFPMSFRDSYASAPGVGYAAVPQQPNSPRVLRSAGMPPSSFPDARPDSPATISRNGHTEESYFVRPEAPFMRSNGRLSESSRNSSYSFAAPPLWNGAGNAASRVSFSTSTPGNGESTVGTSRYRPRRKGSFTSTVLEKEVPIDKPWLSKRDRWGTFGQWLTRLMFLLGVCASAVLCYFGYAGINRIGNVCLVFEDNFDNFDTNTWQREVEFGGFGNGEFQWYTDSDTNSFVDGGKLYIVPTLTSDVIGEDAVFNGKTVNLGDSCTSTNKTQCTAVSSDGGSTVIPPVQSARLTTRLSNSIQYGKIEVTAKMPKGDWLWPAIWMLPVNQSFYGGSPGWPMSGEIDIAESRGNAITYPSQGSNFVSSALHWGPRKDIDAWTKTWGWVEKRRESFSDAFHTYSLEWTPDFMRFYIDKKTVSGLELSFKKKSFFDRGDFPSIVTDGANQVVLQNPWAGQPNSAPFNQPFYLILNVAAGGTNGWFQDNVGGKPWVDQSATAMRDFAFHQSDWYSTWPQDPKQRGMVVDSVKMWRLC